MKKIFIFLLLSCSYIHATGFYPVANFVINYQLSLLKVGGTVVFNASSSYDPDTQNYGYTPKWIWDFNYDGVTFTADYVTTSSICSHSYSQRGTYTVALKYVDNDNYVSAIKTLQIEITDVEYYYYVKDHLGSIRMTVKEDGTVAGYDDYYPFGMVMDGRSGNTSNPDDLYKFTGKERDIETGYDYFGARFYDSRIGRWLSVDPLADKYPGWSPYNYTMNNPLRFVDPDGRFVGDPITVSVAGAAVVIGTGILVTAAILDAAKNNPGKIPSQWEVGASLLKTGLQAYNDIKNWFTEEQKTSGAGSGGAQTREQLESAKESHEDQIKTHEQKLKEYMENPEAGDNKGTLKNAKPEVKEKIINGRIKVLKETIKKHQKELEKVTDRLNKLID